MARKGNTRKQSESVDPKYQSRLVQNIVNNILRCGKKQIAYKIVYKALEIAESELNQDALEILEQAILKTTPNTVVKARRIRGSTLQAPRDIKPEVGQSLAIRWIISSAKTRNNRGIAQKLANEFIDASKGQGGAVRKREEVHRMAESNRRTAG